MRLSRPGCPRLVDVVHSEVSVDYTLGTHGDLKMRERILEEMEMRDRRGRRRWLSVNKARKRVK
jgi:hypothetical protein